MGLRPEATSHLLTWAVAGEENLRTDPGELVAGDLLKSEAAEVTAPNCEGNITWRMVPKAARTPQVGLLVRWMCKVLIVQLGLGTGYGTGSVLAYRGRESVRSSVVVAAVWDALRRILGHYRWFQTLSK